MEEILIDISETGDVTVEGKGINGPDCKLLTKEIEEAIGVVTKTVKKPEFHRTVAVKRTAKA